MLDSIDFDHALPPIDAVMPQTPQLIVTILFTGLAVIFLIYAIWLSLKWKSWMPVLYWIGGQAAVVVEPIADAVLHAVHAPVGQWNVFTSHGHPIPWHIFIAYPWYYGATQILAWPLIARRTLDRKLAWKIFWIGAVWVTLLEQIPILYGVWIYYGPHPFKIGLMPVTMVVPNMASVVMTLLVIYKLAPSINTGWKQLIAIPATGMTALGAHAGSGALMYTIMGMNLEKMGPLWLNLWGAVSLVLGLICVWMTIEICLDRQDQSKRLAPEPA